MLFNVIVESEELNFENISPQNIYDQISTKFTENDCVFDLHFHLLKNGSVIEKYLLPWMLFEDMEERWWNGVVFDEYAVS
jgi:predicted RNA methylase